MKLLLASMLGPPNEQGSVRPQHILTSERVKFIAPEHIGGDKWINNAALAQQGCSKGQ